MKTISSLLFGIFVLAYSLSFSQAPQNIKALEEKYTEYFKLDRELVFLHLNKTAVAPRENIWLSAYVYNPKLDLPNTNTVNLNLDIFNSNGKYLDSKTILTSGGKGSSFIELDPEIFLPGQYFIRATTHYMKNFKEDLSYSQVFTVIGPAAGATEEETSYDLQLLPEGGHLLAGVINTIGVKLIDDSGAGVFFTNARLLNSMQEEITSFKSNQLGMSKFNLLPVSSGEYTVVLETVDGKEIRKKLEAPGETGVSLVSNERTNDYVLSVRTNEATRPALEDRIFFAAIHKDGAIKDFGFTFPEGKLEANVNIHKDSLFPGVNTITIFNEQLQPVLERLIFNGAALERTRISGKRTATLGDSLQIELAASSTLPNNSLSISVLPGGTNSYTSSHNILSAFYLKPYLNGNIDNASYYFSPGEERRKNYDLDLLLLTQGWSKYDWKNIFNNPPRELFRAETGFTIEGTIQKRNEKKHTSLFIRSDETGLFEIANIKDDNTFRLENLYLEDSTEISIGLLNDRNSKITKPPINIIITPNKVVANAKRAEIFSKLNSSTEHRKSLPVNFIDNSISLDTILLQGTRTDTDKWENDSYTFQEQVTINEELESRYFYITDFIATKGFRVIRTPTGVEILNNIPFSISGGGGQSPLIIYNGAPMVNGAELLIDLQSSQVESIVINKRGVGYGMNGGNGVIKIVTKKGAGLFPGSETISSVIASNGFNVDKEFYTPKYSSYTSEYFQEYGAIDWISNISLDAKGKANLSILNTLQPEVKLFIEGMNSQGKLVSEILTIKTR